MHETAWILISNFSTTFWGAREGTRFSILLAGSWCTFVFATHIISADFVPPNSHPSFFFLTGLFYLQCTLTVLFDIVLVLQHCTCAGNCNFIEMVYFGNAIIEYKLDDLLSNVILRLTTYGSIGYFHSAIVSSCLCLSVLNVLFVCECLLCALWMFAVVVLQFLTRMGEGKKCTSLCDDHECKLTAVCVKNKILKIRSLSSQPLPKQDRSSFAWQ